LFGSMEMERCCTAAYIHVPLSNESSHSHIDMKLALLAAVKPFIYAVLTPIPQISKRPAKYVQAHIVRTR
jgi:hypothetical protein